LGAGGKRRGRPRKNWPETIRENNLTWKNALDAEEDMDGWGKCVARYAVLHGKV